MTAYADSIRRPPRTIHPTDQARLLKVTGEHRAGFRDHMILSVGFGTALREHEIAGLDVGDVRGSTGNVKRRFPLRVFKRATDTPVRQDVFLPDALVYKLTKYLAWKHARGESLEPTAPLFLSARGQRIATRTLRHMFRRWQERAGFDHVFNFHSLRHSALTTVCRAHGVEFANRVARHKSLTTTMIYTAPSDEDISRAVRDLSC